MRNTDRADTDAVATANPGAPVGVPRPTRPTTWGRGLNTFCFTKPDDTTAPFVSWDDYESELDAQIEARHAERAAEWDRQAKRMAANTRRRLARAAAKEAS